MIRTLKDDYIEAARARGISERSVVYHHAFKNALVPVITIVGLNMALLLGGAVLTETTFNWPGIGHALVLYLENRDYTGGAGDHRRLRARRRRRQRPHRLPQRVHRPEDPVLMAAHAARTADAAGGRARAEADPRGPRHRAG